MQQSSNNYNMFDIDRDKYVKRFIEILSGQRWRRVTCRNQAPWIYSTNFTTWKINWLPTKKPKFTLPIAIVLPSSRSVKRPICGKSLNNSKQNGSWDSSRRRHFSFCFTNRWVDFFSPVFLSIVQITFLKTKWDTIVRTHNNLDRNLLNGWMNVKNTTVADRDDRIMFKYQEFSIEYFSNVTDGFLRANNKAR